jgi:hypothetical protein
MMFSLWNATINIYLIFTAIIVAAITMDSGVRSDLNHGPSRIFSAPFW